jgi:dolichol kinase
MLEAALLFLLSPCALVALGGVLTRSNVDLAVYGMISLMFVHGFENASWLWKVALLTFALEALYLLELSVSWGITMFVLFNVVNCWYERQHLLSGSEGNIISALDLNLGHYEHNLAIMIFGMLTTSMFSGFNTPANQGTTDFSISNSMSVVGTLTCVLLLGILALEASRTLKRSFAGLSVVILFAVTLLFGNAALSAVWHFPLYMSRIVMWVLRFTLQPPGYYELQLGLYWAVLIVVAVMCGYAAAVYWHWPRTCTRKIFHALVVALFTPALQSSGALLLAQLPKSGHAVLEGQTNDGAEHTASAVTSVGYRLFSFQVLALGVATCLFIVVEYARLRLLPTSTERPIKDNGLLTRGLRSVEDYMRLFLTPSEPTMSASPVNSTAKGGKRVRKLELSHISLLLGCAAPIWLYAHLLEGIATTHTTSAEWTAAVLSNKISGYLLLSLLPYAGLATLGVGDAAAAVVGKLYGRYYWRKLLPAGWIEVGNARTVEGSLVCFATTVAFCVVVLYWQYQSMRELMSPGMASEIERALFHGGDGFKILMVVVVSAAAVTLAEAVTTLNDNVLLPMLMCTALLALQLLVFGSIC